MTERTDNTLQDFALPKAAGVYVLHFPNGKKYVGKTQLCIETRVRHHRNSIQSGRLRLAVHRAGAKYGVGNVIVTHFVCDDPVAEEMKLIAGLRQRGVQLYNATEGGDGVLGFHHAAETRARMSDAAKKSWTNARRERAQQVQKSVEYRAKLSSGIRRSWTDERKLKMAHHIRKRSAKLSDGEVLAIVAKLTAGRSCASLGREYGVTPEAISAIKHGKNWSHVTGLGSIAG